MILFDELALTFNNDKHISFAYTQGSRAKGEMTKLFDNEDRWKVEVPGCFTFISNTLDDALKNISGIVIFQ